MEQYRGNACCVPFERTQHYINTLLHLPGTLDFQRGEFDTRLNCVVTQMFGRFRAGYQANQIPA